MVALAHNREINESSFMGKIFNAKEYKYYANVYTYKYLFLKAA